jgi:hypothetical protein
MDLRHDFRSQKSSAKIRGIPFELTFEEWLQIWQDSDHLHERGRKKGQYCMARFGDIGPYAVWNVKIILHGENVSDGQTGRIRDPVIVARGAAKRKGQKMSPEHGRKVSAAKLGKKQTPEHAAKAAAGRIGLKRSEETKRKMSESRQRLMASGFKPGFCDPERARAAAKVLWAGKNKR